MDPSTMPYWPEVYDAFREWWFQYVVAAPMASVAIAFELVILYLLLRRRVPVFVFQRGRKGWRMNKFERQAFVDRRAADLITDALEDAHLRDEFTRAEVKSLYKRLGQGMQLPDLIVWDWKGLKKAIKGRLFRMPQERPVPLPGEQLTLESRMKRTSLKK